MARGGGGGNLTSYERRILRKTGLMPSQARARGISLASARGHTPQRLTAAGPILREHQIRAIRRHERGEPSDSEAAFLRRQTKRSGLEYDDLKRAFMAKSQNGRDRIRRLQASAQRRYRASKGNFRWSNDAPPSWGQPPGGRDIPGVPGMSYGSGGGGDNDFGDFDYEGYDEPAEFDDALLFYH